MFLERPVACYRSDDGGRMADFFGEIDRVGGVSEWRHRGNGLRVLVSPTPVAPVVGLGVVYLVGSRFEVQSTRCRVCAGIHT